MRIDAGQRTAKADAAVSMVDDAAGAALARVAEVEALLAKGEQLLKADTIGEKVLGAEKPSASPDRWPLPAVLPGAEAEAEKWKAALEEARVLLPRPGPCRPRAGRTRWRATCRW